MPSNWLSNVLAWLEPKYATIPAEVKGQFAPVNYPRKSAEALETKGDQ